jgi:serine/threonine protein kinase
MSAEEYKKYEPIFGSWYITKKLGEGSFGKVFEIEREDFGEVYKSALKAITVPQSQEEVKSVLYEGMDEGSARTYFENFVKDIVSEFVLMSKLKGNSNIVSYEDHIVIPHEDKIGWDILIRMELLTPLMEYAKNADFSERDVIKLGLDMCSALELCQKRNIIHRDIKPENIFISDDGYYKLGDFGIARTIEKTTGGLSKKGTYTYMAPEIYRGEAYGSAVDIYSLGIVMYRLINKNRTPFMPPFPEPITHSDRENALMRRINGEPIPVPAGVSGRLAEIIIKACAFTPAERYSSPMQLYKELEAIQYSSEDSASLNPFGDNLSVNSLDYVSADTPPQMQPPIQDATESLFSQPYTAPDCPAPPNYLYEETYKPPSAALPPTGALNRKFTIKVISIAATLISVLIVALILVQSNNKDSSDDPDAAVAGFSPEPLVSDTPTPAPTPSPAPTPIPTPAPISAQSISIEQNGASVSDISLMAGDEIVLNAVVLPAEASADVQWTSSNRDILAVTANQGGKTASITGIRSGTSTLTVKADNVTREYTIYVNEYEMHEQLGNAILNTSDGVVLTVTWGSGSRARRTVFERFQNNSIWMMDSRDGDYREVHPNFTYERDAFSIGFPTTTRRYFLFSDGTGYFANRDGSSHESLTWEFHINS